MLNSLPTHNNFNGFLCNSESVGCHHVQVATHTRHTMNHEWLELKGEWALHIFCCSHYMYSSLSLHAVLNEFYEKQRCGWNWCSRVTAQLPLDRCDIRRGMNVACNVWLNYVSSCYIRNIEIGIKASGVFALNLNRTKKTMLVQCCNYKIAPQILIVGFIARAFYAKWALCSAVGEKFIRANDIHKRQFPKTLLCHIYSNLNFYFASLFTYLL